MVNLLNGWKPAGSAGCQVSPRGRPCGLPDPCESRLRRLHQCGCGAAMEDNLVVRGAKGKDFVGWWSCLAGISRGTEVGLFALRAPIHGSGTEFRGNEAIMCGAWLSPVAGVGAASDMCVRSMRTGCARMAPEAVSAR